MLFRYILQESYFWCFLTQKTSTIKLRSWKLWFAARIENGKTQRFAQKKGLRVLCYLMLDADSNIVDSILGSETRIVHIEYDTYRYFWWNVTWGVWFVSCSVIVMASLRLGDQTSGQILKYATHISTRLFHISFSSLRETTETFKDIHG